MFLRKTVKILSSQFRRLLTAHQVEFKLLEEAPPLLVVLSF